MLPYPSPYRFTKAGLLRGYIFPGPPYGIPWMCGSVGCCSAASTAQPGEKTHVCHVNLDGVILNECGREAGTVCALGRTAGPLPQRNSHATTLKCASAVSAAAGDKIVVPIRPPRRAQD